MKRIVLISDTHSYIDEKLENILQGVDEIWHAGDIGNIALLDRLREIALVRAVWGNIDDHKLRNELDGVASFSVEGVLVMMTHIGGYPCNYDRRIVDRLIRTKPKIFISGHSHILKVIYDKQLGLLHLNPGAVGRHGFHQIRTALRFTLSEGNISDMEVIELEVIRGEVIRDLK